jgi:hypothetical protein
MRSGEYLTIRDYFDQLHVGRHANRHAVYPRTSNASNTLNFTQILKLQQMPQAGNTRHKSTGLTIADYLANPIRVKCQYNHHMASISQEKKDKNPAKSSQNAVLPSIKTTAAKCTAPPQQEKHGVQTIFPPVSLSSRKPAGANKSLRIEKSIHKASRKYNLPPNLIKGVIKAESNFQVSAVSHAGAQGLMQLMPITAKELGITDPFDIEQNIDGGSRYLRKMLDSFGGDVKLALAAYNAGPGTVRKYDGNVPYQETKHYIDRVLMYSKQLLV